MARLFGVLVVAVISAGGLPAAAQLQAPRPELMTGPPSLPAKNAPSSRDPGPSVQVTPPPGIPLAEIAPQAGPVQDKPPDPTASKLRSTRLKAAARRRRRSDGDDDANRLNGEVMDELRQTRGDIVPPASANHTQNHTPIADDGTARQLARSRAERRADEER